VDDSTHLVSGFGYSPRRSVEESARREHLIPARIKGELHPYAGAPTRTSGEWRLSDTSEKHRRVPNPYFQAFTFLYYFHYLVYFPRIAMLD
jgi:hypothetical protein